ncbi:uncharacterized protein BDR25DRAFT_355669 [Lindgomyces ingoldianus]|uniref:Uncharacterized protein n=1 Tax=Lindgomyces ingoldianus TaxID=673940 RepID=A0ACB6QSG3_9PLEO|nr:uncharacterized protein BDR25DRAFT_355669 [Lindgomyces ingoldianus]KAF2469944.1 hypothetical protein BDR25DRAFT_355669 [Lindgomyces ingoldianus]
MRTAALQTRWAGRGPACGQAENQNMSESQRVSERFLPSGLIPASLPGCGLKEEATAKPVCIPYFRLFLHHSILRCTSSSPLSVNLVFTQPIRIDHLTQHFTDKRGTTYPGKNRRSKICQLLSELTYPRFTGTFVDDGMKYIGKQLPVPTTMPSHRSDRGGRIGSPNINNPKAIS